jgi:hypothetical protein
VDKKVPNFKAFQNWKSQLDSEPRDGLVKAAARQVERTRQIAEFRALSGPDEMFQKDWRKITEADWSRWYKGMMLRARSQDPEVERKNSELMEKAKAAEEAINRLENFAESVSSLALNIRAWGADADNNRRLEG